MMITSGFGTISCEKEIHPVQRRGYGVEFQYGTVGVILFADSKSCTEVLSESAEEWNWGTCSSAASETQVSSTVSTEGSKMRYV